MWLINAHSKRKFDTQDVMVPWVLPAEFDPLRPEAGKTGGKREPPSTVERYCHVFKQGELEELIGIEFSIALSRA